MKQLLERLITMGFWDFVGNSVLALRDNILNEAEKKIRSGKLTPEQESKLSSSLEKEYSHKYWEAPESCPRCHTHSDNFTAEKTSYFDSGNAGTIITCSKCGSFTVYDE